jgi:1-phosphatidylinositol-4-phosphate 5-kinase
MNDYEEIKVGGIKSMNVEIISYAPRVFKTLMCSDGIDNLRAHVNPIKNEQQIRKQVQSDGGKSGQFFFFTYDNRLILKTLSEKERKVIQQRLKNYCEHFI